MLKNLGHYCSAFGGEPIPIISEYTGSEGGYKYGFTLERAEEICAEIGGKVMECQSWFYQNDDEKYHVVIEGVPSHDV